MRRPRALFVAVEAMVVLVLLPVTVNVATGGSAPPGLALIRPFAWYVVAGLSMIAVGLAVWRFVAESRASSAFRYSRFHHETQRHRVLAKLTERVTGELAKLLENIPWLQPRLALAVDAVTPSADILPGDPGDSRPEDIRQAFELFDRNLLILGNPGAGKTTLLLELARRLLVEATESDSPVPVLLGLARWRAVPDSGDSRWPHWGSRWPHWGARRADAAYFNKWCVKEMVDQNGIPRPLAAAWHEDDGVILLLDGLDEMPEQERRGFTAALREVQQQRGPLAMAVSCRTADYARVHPQLAAQGAVEIQPLDRAQVEDLLARQDVNLAKLREALRADDTLLDMVDSPLLLSLLATQVRADDGPTPGADRHASRSRLLERYVTVALASRPFPPRTPVRPATLRQWLTTVARATTHRDLQWSRAWSTTSSHTFANGVLPGLILVGACGLLGGQLLVGSSMPAIVGAAALIAGFGAGAVHVLRSDTQATRRRPPVCAILTGLAMGLFAGGLAAVSLNGLYAIHLPYSWAWWIAGPFLITGIYSLIYQAIRAEQEAHPEKTADADRRHQEAAARAITSKYRVQQEAWSSPEGRRSFIAIFTTIFNFVVVLWFLIIGRAAADVALGIAAGAILEGSVAVSYSIAGLLPGHPVAPLVRVLRPRIIITAAFLSYGLVFANTFASGVAARWVTSASHWPFQLLGVFLGILGGQVVAYRLFTLDTIRTPIADAVARSWLTFEHLLPLRVSRYLAFVAATGIMRGSDGRYFFRHELLAEHCRGDNGERQVSPTA